MIIELRKKSQITLPREIVKELNLQEGDNFEVTVENGCIKLSPVVIYSKEYITKLSEELKSLKEDNKSFNNIDELIDDLEKNKY